MAATFDPARNETFALPRLLEEYAEPIRATKELTKELNGGVSLVVTPPEWEGKSCRHHGHCRLPPHLISAVWSDPMAADPAKHGPSSRDARHSRRAVFLPTKPLENACLDGVV